MSFPVVNYPIYETKLPSTDKKIKFKPFRTAEEKILLMALRGGDPKELETALRQAVAASLLDSKIDIEELPLFDLQYLFLQARIKSIGDVVTMNFVGDEKSECEECRKPKEVKVNLSEIKIEKHPDHKAKIELGNNIGVMMKYPTLDMMAEIENLDVEPDPAKVFQTISKCIKYVYDAEGQYEVKDQKPEDVIAWLDNLIPQDFNKILMFFATMPRLEHTINLECPKCGAKSYFNMETLQSFLSLR